MALTIDELNAALKAVSLIADSAYQSKALDIQLMETEKGREHEKEKMLFQHNLNIHANKVKEIESVKNELKSYGIPYNDLESDGGKKIIEDIGSSKIDNLNELNTDLERLDRVNKELINKITSYKRAQNVSSRADSNKDGLIDANEISSYIEANKDSLTGLDMTVFKKALQDSELSAIESNQLKDMINKANLSEKMVEDYDEDKDMEVTAKKISTLKGLNELNRFDLSAKNLKKGSKEEIKSRSGYAGALGKEVYEIFSAAGNAELAEWANEGFESTDERTRYDSDIGMYTHADKEYMDVYIKRLAKQYAIENQYDEDNIGLNNADINGETELYKRWEKKFIAIATKGLDKNPNYQIKGAVERAQYESALNQTVGSDPEVIEANQSLSNIGPQLTKIFTKGEGSDLEINDDVIENISSNLKKKGISLSKRKIKKSISEILAFTSEPNSMRKLLTENSNFQKIIAASGSFGADYVRMILEYDSLRKSKGSIMSGEVVNQRIESKTDDLWQSIQRKD